MKALLLLLLLPGALFAQDDLWDDEDWGDDEEAVTWTGFVEGGLGSRFDSDPLVAATATLQELRLRPMRPTTVSRMTGTPTSVI